MAQLGDTFQVREGSDAQTSSRFRVLGPLGSGGFGAVFEAIDTRSGQRVAIKQLDDRSARSVARFKQEFRALTDVHHPNLVGLKELIEQDGRWSIVMEFVPGSDFLTYVRGDAEAGMAVDDTRLRHALLGVARGLIALHGFGILHRDLKPSNVRVTPEGRAVLLDFGLATPVDPSRQSTHALTIGTVAYMAPEQTMQQELGPPIDWYAFGVCLFQALTGALPFDSENTFQVLLEKRERPAPLASSRTPEVAPDLDGLCASLLDRDPTRRAGAREVLRILGEPSSEVSGLMPQLMGSARISTPFSGRDAELLQLTHALARTNEGELRIVLVEGESGVGKSELIAEFLRRARSEQPSLVALRGRCYENEHVSYKAFDGCIDELSRVLRKMPERACAQLLPPRSALLGQLFPVLRTIGAIANAPRGEPSADPTARRLEAFTALSSLLSRLAEERQVVLAIDDLQWADAESFRLLLSLAEQAEPPPVLIVASIRPQEERDPEINEQLEQLRRRKPFDVVQLLGLPPAQAEALAERLLGEGVSHAWMRAIVDESHGHPLFLSELVHFAKSYEIGPRGAFTLEAALSARVQRVDRRARELLEVVALAARPYGDHIFARALGAESVAEPARTLLAASLLRLRKGHELGCYHDRIRLTAVKLIPKARLGTLHRSLASALATDPRSDIGEQARHWDLAGDRDRAVEAYERAADAALDALAFLRAAQLCARAIELVDEEGDPRVQRLTVQRAHALARAGHSAEAAELYGRASARAGGEAQIRLRAHYAQHLMLSGKLAYGFDVARILLDELGVHLPRTNAAYLVRIAYHRFWVWLRGTRFAVRPERSEDARDALRHELIALFSNAFGPLHPLAFMLLTLIGVRHAARVPIAQVVVAAWDSLGWLLCIAGKKKQAMRLFAQSEALIERIDDVRVTAQHDVVRGSALLAAWDWQHARASLERAHELVSQHGLDMPSMLTSIRFHLGRTWYHTGDHGLMARNTERWILEARERNDFLATMLLIGMGHGFMRHLMRDQPDDALAELEDAIARVPPEPFSFVHFGHLNGVLITLLYRGGAEALDWLERQPVMRRRPVFLRSSMGREAMHTFQGLCALRAFAAVADKRRAALRKLVLRAARKLARTPSALTRAYGKIFLAQLHLLEGRRSKALGAARAARKLAEGTTHYCERSTRYLEALLESEDPHDPRCTAVLTWLREEGWKAPLKFLQITLPVTSELIARPRLAQACGRTQLGRYELSGPLGGGGFATVFEARELETGRKVALKELVSAGPRSLERFKREFRALRDLPHVNLMRLDALFEHEGRWYIAMECVEGQELTAYCRPHGVADRARIVTAFSGLVEALTALHEAGYVHRDVKSENVRVTSDGRTVLLDYGLIARSDDGSEESGVGSFEYGAPEQLEGSRPTPAADVYAVGVCLYEALSGRLPFQDKVPAALLMRKRVETPPPPMRDPDEIAALTMRLIAREPAARPPLSELRILLRKLARSDADSSPSPWLRGALAPFTGRERELAQLAGAFEETCDVGLTIAIVEGESGVGKTALVEAFAANLGETFPRLWPLRGRCYENEQIAFKAFDGAVDELARALRALPGPTCELLIPKRAALLVQLFPVLESVPAIAHAPKKNLPVDPTLRRRAAIGCFGDLLEQLTKHVELLFVIDDLQWADADSFQLLRTLHERRERLPLLMAFTLRPDKELTREAARELRTLRSREGVLGIKLGGLTETAARTLATELNGSPMPEERLRRLLKESNGHPLFLRELIEHERTGIGGRTAPTLEAALTARILSFSPSAQDLLSLAALAERPYGSHVFARALGVPELPRPDLVALLGRGMLRRSGNDELVTDHDYIRYVSLSLLSPEARRRLAAQLATVLDEDPRAEPTERARLWDEAGNRDRAGLAYELAGDRALAGLSFSHAAQFYARALSLVADERVAETTGARYRSLMERRGRALGSAGHSSEAARVYQEAASTAAGDEAAQLRILAAQHLIQSGQVDEGIHAARELLQHIGIGLPATVGAALGSIVLDRGALALRGRDPRRVTQPLTPRVRMQLEAASALAPALAWIDPLTSAVLSMRYLRIALRSGEPTHVARALSEEAFGRTVQNPRDPAIDARLERARSLAAELRDPTLDAAIMYRSGAVASYRWNIKAAIEQLELAMQIIIERCPDMPFLLTNVRSALGPVLVNRGDHARFLSESQAWLAEARQRGDRFALTMITSLGHGFMAALMANDPDAIEEELPELIASWPREPFSFAHFGELLGMTYQLLYRGGDLAFRWHQRERPRLDRAFMLKSGSGKAIYLSLRTLAVLSAATTAGAQEGARLRAEARHTVRRIARIHAAYAQHAAPLLSAQILALEGRHQQAIALAQEASRKADEDCYCLHADRARFLAALLVDGSEQNETCAKILAHYAAQGWRKPRRVITMWCPILISNRASVAHTSIASA